MLRNFPAQLQLLLIKLQHHIARQGGRSDQEPDFIVVQGLQYCLEQLPPLNLAFEDLDDRQSAAVAVL